MRELPKGTHERILKKILMDANGCWLFQGSGQGKLDYGSVWIGPVGKTIAAHRAMWIIANGRWPGRWEFVCHKCDVPRCCNPEHLFLGTLADNNKDMASKGRYNHQLRTHCVRGHEFTEQNTYYAPSRPQTRQCRECTRLRQAMGPKAWAAQKIYDGSVRRGERKPGLLRPQSEGQK